MAYFVIALSLSIAIYLIFKHAGNRCIDIFSVVLFNYPVCVTIGILHLLASHKAVYISKPIGAWALVLGGLFIASFFLMAKLTQQKGVGVASVVSRVSLVLPVIFFHFYDARHFSIGLFAGIILALASVFLISDANTKLSKLLGVLPILVFLGYGAVDIGLKLAQNSIVNLNAAEHELTLAIFFMAGVYGWLAKFIFKIEISAKAILLGFVLGIVNYYSIYFFLLALQYSGIPSSIIFPLNGIIILLGANIASILLFKESIKTRKVLAISLAVLSIVLLNIERN